MPNTTYGTPFVASSDLVSAYPGVSSTLATRLDEVSYRGNGLNNQTGTNYTLVLTDAGKTVTLSNAAAVTVTIPTNASVAIPTGTIVRFVNLGAGTVTVQPAGGVTLNGGNQTLAQFAALQVVKLATDTWGVVESTGTVAGLTPVTPTSIANSGGTATLSGAAVSFSGVTTVSLNGIFTSLSENYRIYINHTGALAGMNDIWLRLRGSGTDLTGAVYTWAYIFVSAGSGPSRVVTNADTRWYIGYTGDRYGQSVLDIGNPQAAKETSLTSLQFAQSSTSAIQSGNVNGFVNNTTSYDGLTLGVNASNTTGVIRVYRYSN